LYELLINKEEAWKYTDKYMNQHSFHGSIRFSCSEIENRCEIQIFPKRSLRIVWKWWHNELSVKIRAKLHQLSTISRFSDSPRISPRHSTRSFPKSPQIHHINTSTVTQPPYNSENTIEKSEIFSAFESI
jgi:hypothetical protein